MLTSPSSALNLKTSLIKYVVDFKSGFGSNEKGNTNRLLLVATIYHHLEDNYCPLLFVRSTTNNHYFEVLKNSEVWSAYAGNDTYQQIQHYTAYPIAVNLGLF